MTTPLKAKSSIEDIRKRFDAEVERFTNIETGQTATMDAPLVMDLITKAAVASTPRIEKVLDIGCGAGNNTMKLLKLIGSFDCDLVDLSSKMLEKARQRITAVNKKTTRIIQGDFRTVNLNPPYDVIIAAAVLHHLRDDRDWENAFTRIYSLTAPGGSFWITDLIKHETDPVQSFMWKRYGEYLTALQDQYYRDEVFAYIDKEDSPRSVIYQLDLLRRVGFKHVEVLHKNGPCAAFGAIKEG